MNRRSSAKRLLIDLAQHRDFLLARAFRFELETRRIPHCFEFFWMRPRPVQLLGKMRGITRPKMDSCTSVVHDLPHRSGPRRDDRNAANKSFNGYQTEGFLKAF